MKVHPPPSADDIRASLGAVIDPELGSNIVELGMVRDVTVDDAGNVDIGIVLTTARCPLRGQIKKDIDRRIDSLPGVTNTHITWEEMTAEERTRAMELARYNMSQRTEQSSLAPTTQVILVASGKGGVGKSSVTVNLAVALAQRGLKVGVLDADIWGFSVPRMIGVSGRLQAESRDGENVMLPNVRSFAPGEVRVVSMGLLVEDESSALMWRGLMLSRGVQHFLQDVDWGDDLDYLLVDMPPGTGDVQMSIAKLIPRAEVLVVTTPALAAQKVAGRMVSMARKNYLRVAGVIENMSAFVCDHGTSYELFGSGGGENLADEAGVPLLGKIPLAPEVVTGGDTGVPAVLGDSATAAAFRDVAETIHLAAVPLVEMTTCTARTAIADLIRKKARAAAAEREDAERAGAEREGEAVATAT
ncbi:MAG TPA: Mrp/NBP35 family ATP-binding protein [Acidimicrobiales bacterium]|nr:Mrp/NBP35 family ATP-binding protein [Acidimicrobiales bacterium]